MCLLMWKYQKHSQKEVWLTLFLSQRNRVSFTCTVLPPLHVILARCFSSPCKCQFCSQTASSNTASHLHPLSLCTSCRKTWREGLQLAHWTAALPGCTDDMACLMWLITALTFYAGMLGLCPYWHALQKFITCIVWMSWEASLKCCFPSLLYWSLKVSVSEVVRQQYCFPWWLCTQSQLSLNRILCAFRNCFELNL